ncbi:MAG: branched-chain amino acid ABC transporter substrate-binding protein [Coriobacteriia bacterium]|nr:branched-chain amino acid ABC transporter substrate-binding protein [Coriobacteriia bacterium]MCL2745981.1 branched-chain amino acid ABC transporter substrate-binding protein [Coriobacteriia bacterium]MCL2870199.1 branched-chain amino acid ABC transporter substrate-binding protein [Coriobacteriia bacterium]
MKRKLRFILAAMAALALTFALVACDGDNGGSNGDTNGDNGDTTTFAIGFGGPISQGAVSFGQGALNATRLAVDQANASDEARDLGIQFRVVEGDDQSDPSLAPQVAGALISERDLVGVVGHFNSGVTDPAGLVYNEHGVVQISYGSTRPDLTHMGRENFFRTCATDALQGPTAADSAWELGFRTAVLIDDSSPYGEGLAAAFKEQWEEIGGEILLEERTAQQESDFAPVVTRVNAADPDFVFFAGTYDSSSGAGALFARQLKDGGVEAPMMGGDGIQVDGFITEAGPQSEGTIATKPGMPIEDMPEGAAFISDFEAEFGEAPGGFDAFAFDAANAIINAVFEVAETDGVDSVATPAGRRAIIEVVAGNEFPGVTGPVSFDENGDSANPIVSTFLVYDGEWIIHPDVPTP